MTGFLRVKNWERFQHYKDRRPPWIKYHVSLLDDYELVSLEPIAQLVYDRLLLVAAVTDNRIPNDVLWLSRRTHLSETDIANSVEILVKNGFLLLAADASPTRARARSASGSVALQPLETTEAQEITRAWLENAPPLKRHTADYFADSKVQRKLHHALRLYGRTELVQAIRRYALVLSDPESTFEHRYPFGDFLSRDRKEPGCSYFLDDSCLEQWRPRNGRNGVDAATILNEARELHVLEGGGR